MAGKKASLKFGIFLAAICGLWLLWENDAVMDALMSFIMAGVVPGSGKVLTPEQMYAIMGATLLLAIMVIFRSETTRAVRRRKRAVIEVAEEIEIPEVVVEQPEPFVMPEPILVIKLPRQPGLISRAWRGLQRQLTRAVSAGWRASVLNSKMVVAFVRVILVATYNWQKEARRALGALLQKGLVVLRGWLVKFAITVWVYAEPKLYQFDKFIERKLKENKDTAAMLRSCSEFIRQANLRITDIRTRLTRGL